MPRRNQQGRTGKTKTNAKRRPIVSDIPGAAEARTDAFRSDLYLARLKLEAEEQKEAQCRKAKERGASEKDDDASANTSTCNAVGPPEYLISATRVLSCPSCAQHVDETEHHCNDSQYNYGDDSQAMFDDSQHFMDTNEQIAREEESARRHRQRSQRYPHMVNLGRKSLLISSKCGRMFCTDCWEREKKEAVGGAWGGGGQGWHGSTTAGAANDDKRKIPCPICLVLTPSTSVEKLCVSGSDALMGPMSAMGAVLLRGMMMTSMHNANGDTGETMSRDDVRRTAGELVPGTNWRKIGRKRRSDAYVDMTGVTDEAAYQNISSGDLVQTNTKKKKGRPSSKDSGNERGPSVLLPIKEESQSQVLSSHRKAAGGVVEGERSDQDDIERQEEEGPESHKLQQQEQEDETMDQPRPASPQGDTNNATADDGEDTQRLDLDLFRSIAGDGGNLDDDDDESMEVAGDKDLDRADGPTTGVDGIVPNDGQSEDIGRSDGKDYYGRRTETREQLSSETTAAPANSASAADGSTKATSSIGDRKPHTGTDLLAPKRSRIIDPGPSKKRGRMKRRKAGAGLNLRKNKAKALEESLSFHGSQSQASVCGSQSTAGSPPEKKPSTPAKGNQFSFRSESSAPTSQEDEMPVPAYGSADAGASGSQEDGRFAKKQRIDEAGVSAANESAQVEAPSDERKPSAGSAPSAECVDAALDDKDTSMTTPGSKRKHKDTIFETIEEVDDEIIEFTGMDGKVEKRRIDRSHEIIPVNTLVRVANRTFPGSNKLGGTAMVKKSRGSVADNTLVYDVAFVLGGRDTGIPYVYVVRDDAFSDANEEPRATPGSRRRSTRAGRSSSAKAQRPTSTNSSSTRRQSPRSRQSGIEDVVAPPRYTEVEGDEDDDNNDYEEVEAQDDEGREESSQRQIRADTGATAASEAHTGRTTKKKIVTKKPRPMISILLHLK